MLVRGVVTKVVVVVLVVVLVAVVVVEKEYVCGFLLPE
jgi:hypothetical protein